MTDYTASYLVDVSGLAFDEVKTDSSWVHALPLGTYKHPQYGTIDISADRAKRFVESVKNKVRGIDLNTNYEHVQGEASGWVKDAEVRSDGVWLFIDWVKDAAQKIRDGKFKYFSSEFMSKWKDSAGKEHSDVMIGGALTNRPFMKNLVPINLSESTWDSAFELVSFATGTDVDTLKGGSNVPLSDEDLDKIVTKLAEKITPTPPTPTAIPAKTKLTEMPELVALAADNQLVKALMDAVDTQNANLEVTAKAMKDRDIQIKLSEFDRSKIVLTPVARQQVLNFLDKLPVELSEEFWTILGEFRQGTSMLVELGERAGATVNYGSVKTAIKEFDEYASKLMSEKKLSPADAYTMAAEENPALWARYRKETAGV